MKTQFVRLTINLQLAMTLMVLTAAGAMAQQSVEVTKDPCFNHYNATSSRSVALRSTSEENKVKVDFFKTETQGETKRCKYFALGRSHSTWVFEERDASLANTGDDPKTEILGESSSVPAQGSQPSADAETQDLAKKLANPVASLISVPLQSNFDFGMGTGSGWRYTLNIQPVIPIRLNENWNLISRTIIPLIHQGNVTGPNTSQNGLGDTVQSFFFSPNKTEPLIWAVGPVVLLPTATNDSLGGKKWGLGPTALALKQKNGWTYGILANHIWSVAGKSSRSDVNASFVQPFLAYSTKDGWTYTLNTESTYDWVGNSWSVPINLIISKVVRFGTQPISFGGGFKCYATTPSGAPEGCGVRIIVTALFPKKG